MRQLVQKRPVDFIATMVQQQWIERDQYFAVVSSTGAASQTRVPFHLNFSGDPARANGVEQVVSSSLQLRITSARLLRHGRIACHITNWWREESSWNGTDRSGTTPERKVEFELHKQRHTQPFCTSLGGR
jgi:hypothetical protein